MRTLAGIGLAAAAAIGAASPALAQYRYYPPPPPLYVYGQPLPNQVADQLNYHESGTRGRMGLGADPIHPEGPGNARVPSFR